MSQSIKDSTKLNGAKIQSCLQGGRRRRTELEEQVDGLMQEYEEICTYIEIVEQFIKEQKRINRP